MIDERIKGEYMIEAMKAVSQLCGDSAQGRFYKTKADKAKPIHLTSVKELFSEEELKELLNDVKPKMHGCFQTAQKLSMFHGFEYVEGEWGFFGGFGIEHAFNRKGDKYFDLTSEIVLKKNIEEEEFVSIAEFSSKFVRSACLELKSYTALIPYKYKRDKNLDYE
nr:MAG TPA: hypothetical protein [Caudoviricetes sp.]